jgi:hypothetical protein
VVFHYRYEKFFRKFQIFAVETAQYRHRILHKIINEAEKVFVHDRLPSRLCRKGGDTGPYLFPTHFLIEQHEIVFKKIYE